MSGLRPRDVDVFRPYPDEVPWDLLAEAGVDEDTLARVLELNFVRVAKHRGRVVGAYGIRPLAPTRFELVALIVADGYRRQGLGRWLLGHAIGLAETKGGREVFASARQGRRFLEGMGFEAHADGVRLVLTPE
ncbi:MAG: GNAT family N-acetyltransferase [Pseudomonadales bacterium]